MSDLKRLVENDPTLTKFVGSSVTGPKECLQIAEALKTNTSLTELDLKGCSVNTAAGIELAKALEVNTTLKKLNLESNRIEPAGIIAIAEALRKNTSLVELRLNQQIPFGNAAEEKLAETMELYNVTLERLVVTIKNGNSRVKINKCETRNREIARRKRVGQDWSALDPRVVHKDKLAAANGEAADATPEAAAPSAPESESEQAAAASAE